MIDTRISVAVSASILDLNPEFDWAMVSVFNSSSSGLDLMSIFESDFPVRMKIVYFSFTYISSFITSSMVPTTSTTASLSSTTTTITASRPPLPKILLYNFSVCSICNYQIFFWFINLFFFCFSSRMIYCCMWMQELYPCINRFRSWWGCTWSYWLKWREIMMETGGRLFHASAFPSFIQTFFSNPEAKSLGKEGSWANESLLAQFSMEKWGKSGTDETLPTIVTSPDSSSSCWPTTTITEDSSKSLDVVNYCILST